MIFSTQRFLIFSIVFSFISQFGKHFWPSFAYVSGIRVDYLSPTIYFSDILIVALGMVTLPSALRSLKARKWRIPFKLLFLIFILSLNIIVSQSPMPAVYGSIKAIEAIFFGYMVMRHISQKDFSFLCFSLSFAVLIQGALVVGQMMQQSSIGGLWYFLGERTFSSATQGISTIVFSGKEQLRAYGSFPHPNVLAFFMMMSALFTVTKSSQLFPGKEKIWYGVISVIAVISLLLTFSRVAIVLFLASIVYLALRRILSPVYGVLIGIVGIVFITIFIERFGYSSFISEDFTSRLELGIIALQIIKENLLFGVGLNNYFTYQIHYQREITPVLLQPPHTIYLLMILQTGVVGTVAGVYFLGKTLRRLKIVGASDMHILSSVLFLTIMIIGVTDHYFFTLQQGMLMGAFITGIVWSCSKNTVKDLV